MCLWFCRYRSHGCHQSRADVPEDKVQGRAAGGRSLQAGRWGPESHQGAVCTLRMSGPSAGSLLHSAGASFHRPSWQKPAVGTNRGSRTRRRFSRKWDGGEGEALGAAWTIKPPDVSLHFLCFDRDATSDSCCCCCCCCPWCKRPRVWVQALAWETSRDASQGSWLDSSEVQMCHLTWRGFAISDKLKQANTIGRVSGRWGGWRWGARPAYLHTHPNHAS